MKTIKIIKKIFKLNGFIDNAKLNNIDNVLKAKK